MWHQDEGWIGDHDKYSYINLSGQSVREENNEGVWVPFDGDLAYDWNKESQYME